MYTLIKHRNKTTSVINDIVVCFILVAGVVLFIYGWHGMHGTFNGHSLPVLSPDYYALPYYTLRTTMRLIIGLFYSMIFSIVFAVLAAKYAPMRRIILPFVNFMESVPLVGFLTFTTAFFLGLYPHSVMGLEGLAIFAVFTAQAWNMMLTLYQTLRVVPNELTEAADVFRYNPWQKFWRLGFIYSFPGLLWNTMVSQSAAWFALIASEMLTVGNSSANLPGVGSYIGIALQNGNLSGVAQGVLALIANIVIFDQLLFRPLVRYAYQFKYEDVSDRKVPGSWFYQCLNNSMTGQALGFVCKQLSRFWLFVLPKAWYRLQLHRLFIFLGKMNWLWSSLWYLSIVVGCIYYGHQLWLFLPKEYLALIPGWMALTAARVIAAMVLSVIIFTPLGIWIGLRPELVRFFQPIIQILAAIPANVFYPLIAFMIVAWHQDLGMWTIPMIMLGTQWYVLFNVIAGTSMIPSQMVEVSKVFHLRGWLWWSKFTLPAVFPYIVTGVISAAGGAWNTAIAAEVLNWGKITLQTHGLGAFISLASDAGQNPQEALGCLAMCFMVLLCIIFIWQPMYHYAENRFKFD
ncbi:TPA: ABC transporter permease subunit [Escherichia coli]|uniref:ABC transporter permease subunit n=1 Tax=Escherichia albertii TaxID=208962 RepID=UPI0007444D87|nr:ABC transporter permease subunit [Escherichia albertii]MCZ9122220.1 ABC transporter permease subunit [Escherichia albertii]HBA7544042.1 ABC transporter permease subunit [Escherichia coli]